jgi:hypothetical protein
MTASYTTIKAINKRIKCQEPDWKQNRFKSFEVFIA